MNQDDDNTVEFFNPNDIPFGELSNNLISDLYIDNKHWKSVTNYVYSNIVHYNLYKNIIHNSKVFDFREKAIELYGRELVEKKIESMKIGMIHKFKDEQLRKLLISTGNIPLIYNTDDEVLRNEVGPYLMHLRSELMKENIREEKNRQQETENNKIYNIYLAHKFLIKKLDNFESNLQEYLNKTSTEILKGVDKSELYFSSAPIQTIVDLYQKGSMPYINHELENPGTLAEKIREEYLESTIINAKYVLFERYASNLLSEKYKYIEKDKHLSIIYNQLNVLSDKERKNLKEKVYELYMNGKIEVSDENIQIIINFLKGKEENEIGSGEELEEIKESGEEIISPQENKINESEIVFSCDMNEKYNWLSPCYEKTFQVEGIYYPSVFHYIYASLYSLQTSVGNMISAHVKLMSGDKFLDVYTLYQNYNNDRIKDYINTLSLSCKKALTIKFQKREFKELLVGTNKKILIFTDKKDNVLGIGEPEQMNITGILLMELRNTFVKEGIIGNIVYKIVQNTSYERIMLNKKLKDWFNGRMEDIAEFISYFHEYDNKLILNRETVRSLIFNFYWGCRNIYDNNAKIVPIDKELQEKIEEIVPKIPKSCSMEIWRYLSYLIQELLKGTSLDILKDYYKESKDSLIEIAKKENIKNPEKYRKTQLIGMLIPKIDSLDNKVVEDYLDRLQNIVANEVRDGNCSGPFADELDNCIISAVNNVLKALIFYFKVTSIGEKEIKLVFDILTPGGLKVPISEKSDEKNERIKSYLNVNDGIAEKINWYISYIFSANGIDEKARISRIYLFSSQKEKENTFLETIFE